MTEGDIHCIPNNEEKYISFSKNIIVEKITERGEDIIIDHEISFLDSFKFMASTIGTLVDNLDKGNCKNFQKFYKGEKFGFLAEKRCVSLRLCGLTGKTERQTTSIERGVLFKT